jgi:hypothetical protein
MRVTNEAYRRGDRVRVWTGETGTVRGVAVDGWIVVQLDGETLRHEWQPTQVERLRPTHISPAERA